MTFWLDAQLPPSLSSTFHVEAHSLRELGLRDAEDREIFRAASVQDAVVTSGGHHQ